MSSKAMTVTVPRSAPGQTVVQQEKAGPKREPASELSHGGPYKDQTYDLGSRVVRKLQFRSPVSVLMSRMSHHQAAVRVNESLSA